MISFPFRAYRREANHRVALRPSVGGSEVCCRLDTLLLYHAGEVLRPEDETAKSGTQHVVQEWNKSVRDAAERYLAK
jgi:hypothetical protein